MKPGCPPIGEGKASILSWLKGILRDRGIRPIERLGQNFLVDPRGVQAFRIEVGLAEPSSMLEVGPGTCLVTYSVHGLAGKMAAVELDAGLARLCRCLAEECMPGILVARGDGVEAVEAWRVDTIVSNTPYNLTTQIILAGARNSSVEKMILGMQLEVARRLTARPGTRDYGRLTIVSRLHFNARITRIMPRTYYYPEPKVDGALVRMERIRVWDDVSSTIEKLAACLFTGRRKLASKMARICSERLGIRICSQPPPQARVYQLAPEDLLAMVDCSEGDQGRG